ncbi:MAG: type II secretion system F family protein [Planctomycetota bacterium]
MTAVENKLWRWEGVGPRGAVDGHELAMSERDLDSSLARRGVTLVTAHQVQRVERNSGGRMKPEDLVTFTTQLATVLGAGVPIVEGMRDLGGRMRSATSRRVIEDVVRELEAGASLSEAMATRPRSFPPIYRASVHAGELSGAMPEVLRRLAAHMEWTRSIRSTTVQALVYPAILAVAISVLVTVLVTFLVPRIVQMFPGGVDELPTQTRQVLTLSNFITGSWPLLIVGAVALVGAGFWASRSPAGRLWVSSRLLQVPRLGEVLRMFGTAKFAATAATLQNAGCPVMDVIGLAGRATGNAKLQRSFAEVGERVQRGSSISEAMSADGALDPLLIQMVSVGERAGDLGGCLDQLAGHYDRELPRIVKWMLSFLEPALLAVGGVIVAYTLFAAFLPLLDMYDKL